MSNANLVPIHEDTHSVVIDLRYATANNVTGKVIYQNAACFLHETADAHFRRAIDLAAKLGYRFKVFDAFRPREAQLRLWDDIGDPNYISHPETGIVPHCRGVAVDVTLLDANGEELEMGTGFDNFTPRAHHANTEVSLEAQQNRFTLLGIMTAAGWDFYRNEWWHYQLFDARKYAILSQDCDTVMVA